VLAARFASFALGRQVVAAEAAGQLFFWKSKGHSLFFVAFIPLLMWTGVWKAVYLYSISV
jgi:hypothetical protein